MLLSTHTYILKMRKSRWDYNATKMSTKANDEQTDDDGIIEKKNRNRIVRAFPGETFQFSFRVSLVPLHGSTDRTTDRTNEQPNERMNDRTRRMCVSKKQQTLLCTEYS